MDQSRKMARIAWNALNDKKGEDIKIIDITGISVLADYFIIANGTSDSQVNALVDNVEEKLHKAGYSLKQREGQAFDDPPRIVTQRASSLYCPALCGSSGHRPPLSCLQRHPGTGRFSCS